MKKPAAIVALIIFNLCFTNTWAQVKLTSARIKEILIHNVAAGLGGGTVADIKVVPEGGQWHSYLIRKTTSRFSMERKTFDSTIHKLIATVDPLLISGMLNGLAVIKPVITPTTFSLRASQLIADIKSKAKAPIIKAPDFGKLVKQKDIDDAIAKTVVNMNVMDDFQFCEIGIVTDRNDTIKLSTRNVCATKLPWTLNNLLTYDMAFNNFVVAAIGAEDVPNKKSLNINSLKESIYNCIDAKNPGAPIATFKWDYGYPENLKLLTDHFIISKSFRTGDEYSCTMRTKGMHNNALIYGWINMASTQDIKTVIAYAALIEKHF